MERPKYNTEYALLYMHKRHTQNCLGVTENQQLRFFRGVIKDFLFKTKWEKIFSRTFVTRYRVSEI